MKFGQIREKVNVFLAKLASIESFALENEKEKQLDFHQISPSPQSNYNDDDDFIEEKEDNNVRKSYRN